MNFQPLGKRVLVKRVEEATTTMSGIIIPDNAQEKPSRGEVVAVSKEVTELANGNQVLFGKYAGNEVSFEGTKYMVLEVDDIFGIINWTPLEQSPSDYASRYGTKAWHLKMSDNK